ncbi:MAG: hypothetical protein LBD47_03010 [Treponema sp.]|nr:hypothetical protein [Treponema sp.]
MTEGTRFDLKEKFAGLDFHSVRLEERFVRTMETLINQPGASIWEASEDRAEASDVSPRQSTGCWGMNVLTGRRSSGCTGKRPKTNRPAMRAGKCVR